MTSEDKVRENRLRRMAQRQGLTLSKSRRRDPLAVDYGQWLLTPHGQGKARAFPDLDQVERFLTTPPAARGGSRSDFQTRGGI
jgi:hypothetical protein